MATLLRSAWIFPSILRLIETDENGRFRDEVSATTLSSYTRKTFKSLNLKTRIPESQLEDFEFPADTPVAQLLHVDQENEYLVELSDKWSSIRAKLSSTCVQHIRRNRAECTLHKLAGSIIALKVYEFVSVPSSDQVTLSFMLQVAEVEFIGGDENGKFGMPIPIEQEVGQLNAMRRYTPVEIARTISSVYGKPVETKWAAQITSVLNTELECCQSPELLETIQTLTRLTNISENNAEINKNIKTTRNIHTLSQNEEDPAANASRMHIGECLDSTANASHIRETLTIDVGSCRSNSDQESSASVATQLQNDGNGKDYTTQQNCTLLEWDDAFGTPEILNTSFTTQNPSESIEFSMMNTPSRSRSSSFTIAPAENDDRDITQPNTSTAHKEAQGKHRNQTANRQLMPDSRTKSNPSPPIEPSQSQVGSCLSATTHKTLSHQSASHPPCEHSLEAADDSELITMRERDSRSLDAAPKVLEHSTKSPYMVKLFHHLLAHIEQELNPTGLESSKTTEEKMIFAKWLKSRLQIMKRVYNAQRTGRTEMETNTIDTIATKRVSFDYFRLIAQQAQDYDNFLDKKYVGSKRHQMESDIQSWFSTVLEIEWTVETSRFAASASGSQYQEEVELVLVQTVQKLRETMGTVDEVDSAWISAVLRRLSEDRLHVGYINSHRLDPVRLRNYLRRMYNRVRKHEFPSCHCHRCRQGGKFQQQLVEDRCFLLFVDKLLEHPLARRIRSSATDISCNRTVEQTPKIRKLDYTEDLQEWTNEMLRSLSGF